MSDDADTEDGTDQPHRVIRILSVVLGASVIGATLGAYVAPPTTLGAVLVAIPIMLIALAGTVGLIKGEPIVGALAGLGLLLILEGVLEVAIILLAAALGYLFAALLVVLETRYRDRQD